MAEFTNDGKFTVLNEEGKTVECEILFTFENSNTGKNYMVYTDNTVDDDGNTRVYAAIIDPNSESLQPLESEEEWKVVEEALAQLKDEVKNDIDESLDEIVERVKNVDSQDVKAIIGCINDVTDRLFEADDGEECLVLFDLLKELNPKMEHLINFVGVGLRAYEKQNFALAEMAFLEAKANNNLAYIARRKEVKDPNKYTNKDIAELLQEGVHEKEAFSIVNMALLWALNVGGDSSWELADSLMSHFPREEMLTVLNWWLDVAKKGDIEGYLVHYWLLKHEMIDKTPLGTREELLDRLSKTIKDFPEFMWD